MKNGTIQEAKLRKLIQEKVLEFLTQKKVLAEAKEKEGHGKPTSGLTKTKVGDTNTVKLKGKKNPPAKKVTDESPAKNTFLTGAEPTETGNETKVIKIGRASC